MNGDENLADRFGEIFSVRVARAHGIGHGRLRGHDLQAPFHGVRAQSNAVEPAAVAIAGIENPYERQRRFRIERARTYAARLHTGHFFSHQTAASIWGAPLPIEFTESGALAEGDALALHVSVLGYLPFPRASGIVGHRTYSSLTTVTEHIGLRVASPATTWVSLGGLSVHDLVALGDFFCREWREGYGRPDAGRAPLATRADLEAALEAGRRYGAARLREALSLIREDSWSPRESLVRCILLEAHLPEPELNVDVFDSGGRFLGCVDMAYPDQRVAVEYLGMLHGEQWAADVERLAALRAAGWTVVEITSPLLKRPEELVRRVADALAHPIFV
ncbi:hypothetical protein [Microbacterium suwonense]|uniref:DUF559 domain-containing protein n=1 Tax=Microbacterium suwonense TaxID=683047 RepID=A0ABN6X6S3_9MICO|nr:hypothetical protein [Microbacterium suwonense]BDZ40384.1 hypothetical protein GCM10025863_29980 [Microbacterium suwonense]